MQEQALQNAHNWINNVNIDQIDRDQVKKLIDENRTKEITESFYKDLEFGTGGLRSIIGQGTNRINKYNVRRATQAMCNLILRESPSGASAVVSYDCRNMSIEFAKEVATTFAANGIKCFIFNTLTPTPILSYAIRYYRSHAGVMITASHNPKEYNGFKAYWKDGAQVTPPQDQIIIDEYKKLTDFSMFKTMDYDQGVKDERIIEIYDEVHEAYYKMVESLAIDPELISKEASKLKVLYTPLHGTGKIPCTEISKRMGFSSFELFGPQSDFDGNFSAVKSTPNPEDPIALGDAVDKMLGENFDLCYGTDPDSDRLGVVVNHQGKANYLNGNQIALLMINYMLKRSKELNKLPSRPLIIKSIVTSDMQNHLARAYGATVMNTLTGFKWMAKLWHELQEQGSDFNFFFASEESFGYMTHEKARDKDAVAAIAMMNEVALSCKVRGVSLIDELDQIYETYGFGVEDLLSKTYAGIEGQEKIQRIMQYFRENHAPIASLNIQKFADYLTGIESDIINKNETPLNMTKSNVIGFTLEGGHKLFLRPSGTEPKIKFYTMAMINEGSLEEKKHRAQQLIQDIRSFLEEKLAGL